MSIIFFKELDLIKKDYFILREITSYCNAKKPCHKKNYDNEELIEKMFKEQKDMKIPKELIPKCPVCKGEMIPNLRGGDYFVEDEGWHQAALRYEEFLSKYKNGKIVFMDLGSGMNTPSIFKFPFMKMTYNNEKAIYVAINLGEAFCIKEIEKQSICINRDIGEVLLELLND